MIALFFATTLECRLIAERIENKQFFRIKNTDLIKGRLFGYEILLCISGVGKINSTISSMITLEKFPIKKVLISGIAGAYPSSGLKIGEIAVATKEVEVDQGLLMDFDRFISMDFVEVELTVPHSLEGLKRGIFLTVSSCTGNLKRAKFLESKFGGICENMEGAAIAKVCSLYDVPVFEIRSISNYVEDRESLLSRKEVEDASEVVEEFILERFPQIFELP